MNSTRKNLELILAHLVGKPIALADLQQALEWAAVDPEAQTLFEQLLSLLSGRDDPAWLEAIAAASEGVITPEVADLVANREALTQLDPDLVAHFETLLATNPGGQEVLLPGCPTFVEQFEAPQKSLSQKGAEVKIAPLRSSIWETVESAGQQVGRLFAEISVLMSQEIASFGQLPPPLRLAEVTLPAVRSKVKATSTKKLIQTLPLPSPEHDLSLSLRVGPISGNRATLSIQVGQISSQQPLNRARVTIQNTENQALESDLTRENGTVTFQNIEPGSYLIQVKYQGQILELPITFVLAPETTN